MNREITYWTAKLANGINPDTMEPEVEVLSFKHNGENIIDRIGRDNACRLKQSGRWQDEVDLANRAGAVNNDGTIGNPLIARNIVLNEEMRPVYKALTGILCLEAIAPNLLVMDAGSNLDELSANIRENGQVYNWDKFHRVTITSFLSNNDCMIMHGTVEVDSMGLAAHNEEQALLDDDTTDPYGPLHTCIGSGTDFWCFDWHKYDDGKVKLHAVINSETGSFIMDVAKDILPNVDLANDELEQYFSAALDWCAENYIVHDTAGWNFNPAKKERTIE